MHQKRAALVALFHFGQPISVARNTLILFLTVTVNHNS